MELQKRKKKVLRIVTPLGRTWELQAETETERNDWINTLEKIWNSRLTLPQYEEEEVVYLEDGVAVRAIRYH